MEVVATGLARPTQIALGPAGSLVVLSHGHTGDVAGELQWLDVKGGQTLDVSRIPRLLIPFPARTRQNVLGSLAVHPGSGDLFLGEENGNRVYRLVRGGPLAPLAIGLHHLVGGGGLAVDRHGRLIVLDFVSPETELRLEAPPPLAIFDWPIHERYQGPVVFRIDPAEPAPRPRRLDLVAPLFPKGWSRPRGEFLLPRFISVTTLPSGDLVFLSSLGEILRLTEAGDLRLMARLPSGHYHRTNMAAAPDGSLLVSAGFHIRELLRVSPQGNVTTVARGLSDPGGVVVDEAGHVYVVETALHRIIRIVPAR
jgi:hypothetical protein